MALAALLVMAAGVFMSLGMWQVHRLAWKQSLVARVERQVQAAPVPAPAPAAWPGLMREADEYRRVVVRGEFAHARETLVAATTELGSGYWVMTPLHTEQGHWVLVNRGFVPPELRDRSRRRADEPLGVQTVVGLMRWTEPGGRWLQANNPAAGRWYSRDVAAIASSRELADSAPRARIAPYFIDATPLPDVAPGHWPRAGLTVLRFSNNHRIYAATWFALAVMSMAGLAYLALDERRLRRLAEDAPFIRATDRHLIEQRP